MSHSTWKNRFTSALLLWLCCFMCSTTFARETPYIQVLGVAQDGGYPHMGCTRQCCTAAWAADSLRRNVVSLALVDPESGKWWLFEATPDIKEQLHYFQQQTRGRYRYLPDGIFITHAHIGHYTGLMQLGREVMGTKDVPVYVLPRMRAFLENNGPWSQLVTLHNILLHTLAADTPLHLAGGITVAAFTVPHRDEFSETAGFRITTPDKKYLFIPDVNKWAIWNRSITDEVKSVDIALLDGTFYDSTELRGRNMKEVPHPLVCETMALFARAAPELAGRVYFIHMNHTNPLLWDDNKRKAVRQAGFSIALQGQKL